MKDFRISSGEGTVPGAARSGFLRALVNAADEIGRRFEKLAENVPYRSVADGLDPAGVPDLARSLVMATWKRNADAVPDYSYAEGLGRRYRRAGAELGSLLLHWHLFRRAVHLCLAAHGYRTGHGDPETLRQMALMDYTIDWGVQASIVGWVLAEAEQDG